MLRKAKNISTLVYFLVIISRKHLTTTNSIYISYLNITMRWWVLFLEIYKRSLNSDADDLERFFVSLWFLFYFYHLCRCGLHNIKAYFCFTAVCGVSKSILRHSSSVVPVLVIFICMYNASMYCGKPVRIHAEASIVENCSNTAFLRLSYL